MCAYRQIVKRYVSPWDEMRVRKSKRQWWNSYKLMKIISNKFYVSCFQCQWSRMDEYILINDGYQTKFHVYDNYLEYQSELVWKYYSMIRENQLLVCEKEHNKYIYVVATETALANRLANIDSCSDEWAGGCFFWDYLGVCAYFKYVTPALKPGNQKEFGAACTGTDFLRFLRALGKSGTV